MRIAILGGSFDPVHNGHLQIAKYAKKHLPIDEVWFMPTLETPLKEHQLASFKDRSAMIKRAIHPYRYMKLCSLEKNSKGKSFTIDTVHSLMKKYPAFSFSWLIGSDQAKQLHLWKDIDLLMELIPFYVFSREGQTSKSAYPLQYVSMPLISISSTQLRQGQQLHMLPYAVRKYIGEHRLYLETMVQHAMNEHRYNHSKSVAELSRQLAKAHHVNEEQAYTAGLLHDVCKQWKHEQSNIWMRHMEPKLLQEHPNIWHGYIASTFVKRYYKIEDRQILHAIRNHVKGSRKSPLAMIVYVADKLDPKRGYESGDTIALCKKNLEDGYVEVMRQQASYLQKTIEKE